MKAVIAKDFGDSDILKTAERQVPDIQPDELLIRNYASSVNPLDWKILQGEFKNMYAIEFPFTPGHDFAGEVIRIGKDVTRFQKGDKVYGMVETQKSGTYAQYIAVSATHAVHMPQKLSYTEAAAIPLTAMTAYTALVTKGRLKGGDDILVNGASGGVGVMAIQLAKALQAGKITGVTSEENIDLVKSIGADRVINYEKQQFVDEEEIYEIVFDTIGNTSFLASRKILEPKGKFISTIATTWTMIFGFLTSLYSGRKCLYFFVSPNGKTLKTISKFVEDGKVQPVIDKTYKLADVEDAFEYSQTGKAKGKIAIEIP